MKYKILNGTQIQGKVIFVKFGTVSLIKQTAGLENIYYPIRNAGVICKLDCLSANGDAK